MMTPYEIEQLAEKLAERLERRLAGRVDTEALMDAPAVAELLGCSLATVERRTRCGEIPSIKLGRLRRYERSAVLGRNEKGGGNHGE
jgi:excisionase family DNA binding protein